jgi:hypothetical protein
MPTPLIETPTSPGKSILVTGKKRDGKSWYVFNRIFMDFKGPAIFIDPKGADSYIKGEVRRTVEQVKSYPANKIIFQIQPGSSTEKFDEEVAKLIEYLVSWKRGYPKVPLLVVLDESYRYMSKFAMDEGPNTLVQTCSALDISTIIINPDYSTVPRILYMQSDYVIFFTAHPVIESYLEDRLTMQIPPQVWTHVSRNQTDIMAKKGYGMMLDWSDRIWLIFPDGHMDVVEGVEKDGTQETNDGDNDIDGDTAPAPDGKGTDSHGPASVGSPQKPPASDGAGPA